MRLPPQSSLGGREKEKKESDAEARNSERTHFSIIPLMGMLYVAYICKSPSLTFVRPDVDAAKRNVM